MSRSSLDFVVCFTVLLSGSLCLSGCNQPTSELKEKPQHVTPGTLLQEADFEETLRTTGAKFVVVQVYADACGPCITEALKLTQVEKQWRSEGIAILGLGMDETPAGPKSFFESTGGRVEFPLYCAPWFAKQQQVEATPVLFIYSATGGQLHRCDPLEADISAVEEISEKLADLMTKQ